MIITDRKFKQLFTLHANFYKLLANPRRLEIISLLTHGELTVKEIEIMVGVPQPNVSQHLKILKIMGVVKSNRDGVKIRYRLASHKLSIAISLAREAFADQTDPAGAFEIVADPVCGMKVNKRTAESVVREGKTYYFCAAGCLRQFQKQSEKFIRNQL